MESVTVKNNLSTPVDIQITEYQIRPLSKLEPAQQREAWQKAVATAPEGKVTAAHVSIEPKLYSPGRSVSLLGDFQFNNSPVWIVRFLTFPF